MQGVSAGTDVAVAAVFVERCSKGPNVLSGISVGETDAVYIVVINGDGSVKLVGKECIWRGVLVSDDATTNARVRDTHCAE